MFAIEMADALDAAHAEEIIHRDFKVVRSSGCFRDRSSRDIQTEGMAQYCDELKTPGENILNPICERRITAAIMEGGVRYSLTLGTQASTAKPRRP